MSNMTEQFEEIGKIELPISIQDASSLPFVESKSLETITDSEVLTHIIVEHLKTSPKPVRIIVNQHLPPPKN